MPELWMPRQGKRSNGGNLFDLMEHFQEVLDDIRVYEEKIMMAHFATDALHAAFSRLQPERREVTVVTELAILEDQNDKNTISLASNVGLMGNIEHIHCVEYDEVMPLSVTLELDVMHAFLVNDPDTSELVLTSASAPISSVRYIETLAS